MNRWRVADCIVLSFLAGAAVGMLFGRHTDWLAAPAMRLTAAECWVHGSAVDEDWRSVAGVEVRAGARRSVTNASGQWGFGLSVTAGQKLNLYITPAPLQVHGPPSVRTRLIGDMLEVTVVTQPGATLGPFVITMRSATPTATSSATPRVTATVVPTPRFIEFPEGIAETIAAAAWTHSGERLATMATMQTWRGYRYARQFELGWPMTNRHEMKVDGVTYAYQGFAQAIVVERGDEIGLISPHGRWRYWENKEP